MQVQIAIGENHRFELREALLVYYGNQTTFITKHEVLKPAEDSTCSRTGATAHRGICRVARSVAWGWSCSRGIPREHPRQERSHDCLVDTGTAPSDVLSTLRGKGS